MVLGWLLRLRLGWMIAGVGFGFILGSCGASRSEARYRAYYQHLYAAAPAPSPSVAVAVVGPHR